MKLNRSAFTIIEIVIALAVFIIGVSSCINLFPIGLHATKRAGDFSSVGFLGQYQMNSIRVAGWSVYGTPGGYTSDPDGYPDHDEATFADYPGFSWLAVVEDIGTNNLRKVELAIYWNDRGNETSETFISYIANKD